MADSLNMEKITIWTTAFNLYDKLKGLYSDTFLGDFDKKAWQPMKAIAIKNFESWAVVYLWCTGKVSTAGWGYPLSYNQSISFTEAQLEDISIISDTASTDVRWFIV